jgi:anti-sigma factor RsiW
MRHIPDDELHAYLDQALSRAQCVEIESHLAHCARCRTQRDQIAALRDRTTSLLASLGPRRVSAPQWSDLAIRAEQRRQNRRRQWEAGAWAASLLLAIGLGYGASQWQRTEAPLPVETAAATRPPEVPAAPVTPTVQRLAVATPSAQASRRSTPTTPDSTIPAGNLATWFAEAAHSPTAQAPEPPGGVEVSALTDAGAQGTGPVDQDGIWRTVPLDSSSSGSEATRVDGLQVVQVQVHQVGTEGQITAVEQRLVTGEVIRTVEGPASLLADLMAHQIAGGDSGSTGSQAGSDPTHVADATLTRRVGNRVVLLSGPPEMLSTLMTRMKLASTR